MNILLIAFWISSLTYFFRAKRANYGDAAVGYVELMREQHKCTIWAKICPEHRVQSKPYNVYVIVYEKAKTIVEAMCTDCAASEGGCKHAVAY